MFKIHDNDYFEHEEYFYKLRAVILMFQNGYLASWVSLTSRFFQNKVEGIPGFRDGNEGGYNAIISCKNQEYRI